MTKRTTGAAQAAAPVARKRKSGASGRNLQAQRLLRAPQEFFELLDEALEHNRGSKEDGGYAGFSDWARRAGEDALANGEIEA